MKAAIKPRIALITPALAAANNGNWHTASRWAAMLAPEYDCDIALTLAELPRARNEYAALLALHARRSAASMADFAKHCPGKPIVLALTGTDLYRDIHADASAQQSLDLAHTLIVLQDQAVHQLPAQHRPKAVTLFQSCPKPKRQPLKAHSGLFEVVIVGHLRDEKSPDTVFAVAAKLAQSKAAIRMTHLGAGLDAQLALLAQHTQARYPQQYRWLGAQPHPSSLQTIAQADLLLHPSVMEGGANVVIEAVQHGTPVLASRIDGNVGMLGLDYAGYFELKDTAACAAALLRAASDAAFLAQLKRQCALRSPLFSPQREENTLRTILGQALQSNQIKSN